MDAPPFVVGQPEGLVTPIVNPRQVNGTAGDKAKLVLPQLGNAGSEGVAGVKSIVSKELED